MYINLLSIVLSLKISAFLLFIYLLLYAGPPTLSPLPMDIVISWMLHQIFMASDKVKLASG